MHSEMARGSEEGAVLVEHVQVCAGVHTRCEVNSSLQNENDGMSRQWIAIVGCSYRP